MKHLNKFGNIALAAIAMAVPQCPWIAQAATGGGMDGGGGDVVILKDDQVVLADPFVRKVIARGDQFELHQNIVSELRLLGKLLVRYGADATENRQSAFIEDKVLSPLVEYRFVSVLPSGCERVQIGALPEGANNVLAACTQQFRTWIREDLFKKMTIREQAKLILHERLRAITPSPKDSDIADITVGAEELLSLYFSLMPEDKRDLGTYTDTDVQTLETLRKRIAQLGLGNGRGFSDWKVSPNGGGLVHVDAKIAADATIGIGSIVGPESRIDYQAQLLGFIDCWTFRCELGAKAILISDQEGDLEGNFYLARESGIMSSKVGVRSGTGFTKLAQSTYIRNSVVQTRELELGFGAVIDGTAFEFEMGGDELTFTLKHYAHFHNAGKISIMGRNRSTWMAKPSPTAQLTIEANTYIYSPLYPFQKHEPKGFHQRASVKNMEQMENLAYSWKHY